MATHAHSTRLRAVVPHLPRAALEDLIERSLTALDAMDRDVDMEPDADGEAEPDEVSAQPATLAPDWQPAQVIRFPARQAVRS